MGCCLYVDVLLFNISTKESAPHRRSEGPELPAAVFSIYFCEHHGAHAIKGGVAGEVEAGNLFAAGIYGTDEGVLHVSEMLVLLAALVYGYYENDLIEALIE